MCKHPINCLVVAFLFIFSAANLANANENLVLRRQTFYDPGSNNMASHTMLIPQGWTATGAAWWAGTNYFNNLPSQEIKVTSPDGCGIVVGPTIMASDFRPNQMALQYGGARPREMQSDNGRVVLYRPDNLRQWKTFYEQKVIANEDAGLSNQRVIEVMEIKDLTSAISNMMAPIRQDIEQTNELTRQMGFEQIFECMAVGFTVEYVQNGRRYERLHILGVASTITTSDMGPRIDWGTIMDVSFHAPKGQLESRIAQLYTIANSLRQTPEWAGMVNRHLAKMRGISMDGLKKRHEITMSTMEYIRDLNRDSTRRHNESVDRTSEQFNNYIRGVEVYTEGEYAYELPNNYRHVYGDGQGNFILTDDGLYNPNTDNNLNGNWNRLQSGR